MRFLSFGLLAVSWTTSIAADNSAATTTEDVAQTVPPLGVQDGFHVAQEPMRVEAMHSRHEVDSARHRQEKAHLMKRLDRKHGKWGPAHPRYRLLESLFGFTNYRDSNMVELKRWRSLYRNTGKQQMKVSYNVALIYSCLTHTVDLGESGEI
jgi:hypothetical protein